MDAVDRIAIALVKVKRSGAQRIVRSAGHAACPFCRIRIACDHFGRGRPGRPLGPAPHPDDTRPTETFAAHTDAVANRLTTRLDQIEEMLVAIDDNRARNFRRAKRHHLSAKGLGNLIVSREILSRFPLVVVHPFLCLGIVDLCLGKRCKRNKAKTEEKQRLSKFAAADRYLRELLAHRHFAHPSIRSAWLSTHFLA